MVSYYCFKRFGLLLNNELFVGRLLLAFSYLMIAYIRGGPFTQIIFLSNIVMRF